METFIFFLLDGILIQFSFEQYSEKGTADTYEIKEKIFTF